MTENLSRKAEEALTETSRAERRQVPGPAPMRITRLFSWRAVRVTLFILGLSTLAGLIHQIGPLRIYEAAAKVGPLGMVIILLPSTVMYLIDCVGWRMTLGGHARKVSFFRLFMIRMAGEVVNATTPTGSVGGEPVKAYLLERYGISIVDGFASVIIAKTTMTIAQIAYILTGIGLGFALLLPPQGIYLSVMAILTSLALVSLGIALLMVQRQGLFTILFALLRKWRWRVAALEGRRQKLLALDQAVLAFYSRSRAAFLLSTAAFLAGWMVEAVEVYLILGYLGATIDPLAAISIDALSTFIRGATFVVPASVGAQEAGSLMLVTAFGHSDVIAMTFALLRRIREVAWIAIGLVCLMLLKAAPINASQ